MANEYPVPSSNAETTAIATTNGQTAFSFDWRADAADQVHAVYRPVGATGRVLVLGVDFSVQGLQNPSGGSILLVGFSANKDDVIYIYRDTLIEREKKWQNEGDYKADLVNKEQDNIYMIMQELKRGNGQALNGLDKEIEERKDADENILSLIGNIGSGNAPIFDSKSALLLATVDQNVHAIRLNGSVSVGDGLGGLYIDEDNGSTDTASSADGRTWYRVRDETSQDTRKKLSFIVHADSQPRINDTAMPAGMENIQWGIFMNVLDDMGRNFGGKTSGILHCGDLSWVAAMSSTSLSGVRLAAAEMNPSDLGYDLLEDADNMTVGDEYPWGFTPILDEIERRAGVSRSRVFVASGNHDRSGGGSGTNPVAESMAVFESYFGKTSYHVIEGSVGFYFLGSDSTTGGGQIMRRSVDQARRVFRSHKNVKHWAFFIHQPPAGRHPDEAAAPTQSWGDPVTLNSSQVSSWGGGGQPLITVGAYAGQRTNRTNIFLIHPYLGKILLKHGRDYLFSTDVDGSSPAGPYNQIQLLQTWAHGTPTTSTTLQLNEALRIGATQDGPSTILLEELFAEVNPFAVFHGHVGEIWSDSQENIRVVPEWGGSRLVNMNMSIPARARVGIDPINAPLISGLLEFDSDAGTAKFRYWNHTATIDGSTGEYIGDWLSVTHPSVTSGFIVNFGSSIDLGVEGMTFDGRRDVGREAVLNYLAMERDIRETPSRSDPLRNPDGSLITTVDGEGNPIPTYSIDAPGRVKFGDFAVTDRSRKDISPGDGGFFEFAIPRGIHSDTGGESNWRDDQPSADAFRMYWETTSGVEDAPVGAMGFEALDPSTGQWRDLFRMAAGGIVSILGNPIIESGTNANGSYVKYYDGTLVCTGEVDITDLPTDASVGTKTVTLPYNRMAFGYAPTAQITINASSSKWSTGTDRGKYIFSSRSDAVSTLTILYYAIAGTSPTGPEGSIGYTLHTRWK